MKKLILFTLILCVAVINLSFTSFTEATDFSGNWSGYFYGEGLSSRHGIEITINQTGETISSTSSYTTSSVVGSFGGTVEGDSFIVDFSHTEGSCTVSGDATATLRDTVLVFTANVYDCEKKKHIVRGAVVKAGWTEYIHNAWINLSQSKYPSSLLKASLWAGIDDPDEEIAEVSIITPNGAEIGYFYPGEEVPLQWETYYTMPLSHIDEIWPDGVYVWNILLKDSSKRYYFAMSQGDFPNQYPNLTSPTNGGFVDATIDNLFQWDAWVKDSSPPGKIYFGLNHSCCFTDNITSTNVSAGTLSSDELYGFEINFHFDSNYRMSKNNDATTLIRTGRYMVKDTMMHKVKVKLDSGEVGGLRVSLWGLEVKSVLFKKDDTTILSLKQGEEGVGNWFAVKIVEDMTSFANDYPDGDYVFAVTYVDNSTENVTVTLQGDYPAVYPEITYPTPGSQLNWKKDISATWSNNWLDYGKDENFVVVTIGGSQLLAGSDEVWGDIEGDLSSGVSVPPGVMTTRTDYLFSTIFFRQDPGQTGVKGTARSVGVRSFGPKAGNFPWHSFLPSIIPRK